MSKQLKCVEYLNASNFCDARTKCIRDTMNYLWTEEDSISDERTEAIEDAVDGLINLGYEPFQITIELLSESTDHAFVLNSNLVSPVHPIVRQEVINEYLPLDTRVKRWSMEDDDPERAT